MWNFIRKQLYAGPLPVLALLIVVLALLWVNLTARQSSQGVAVAAKEAPQVAQMDKVTLTPKKVKAYPQKAKQKLALPETVADNPSVYALGANRIEPDWLPVTVTTTLDTETGEVQVYEKREPLPWLALPKRGEAGLAYGFKNGQPNARLFVRQSLLDVKALRIGVEATADQDGETFAGASLAWRW